MRTKRVRRTDKKLADSIRGRFVTIAGEAKAALLAGNTYRHVLAPETYATVSHYRGRLEIDLVVDNFLLASVRRGGKIPRIEDGDRDAFQKWVDQGPAILVESARHAVSMLHTVGASSDGVVTLAKDCRKLSRR